MPSVFGGADDVVGVQTSTNIDNNDGEFISLFPQAVKSATESVVSVPAAEAGTLKRHVVNITTNTGSNDLTLTTRIAGSPGNNIITVTGGNTGIFSSNLRDEIAQDDLIDYVIAHVSEAATITLRGYSTTIIWR